MINFTLIIFIESNTVLKNLVRCDFRMKYQFTKTLNQLFFFCLSWAANENSKIGVLVSLHLLNESKQFLGTVRG